MDGGDLGTEPHGDPRSQCGVARSRGDTDDSEAPHSQPLGIHRGFLSVLLHPWTEGPRSSQGCGGNHKEESSHHKGGAI